MYYSYKVNYNNSAIPVSLRVHNNMNIIVIFFDY